MITPELTPSLDALDALKQRADSLKDRIEEDGEADDLRREQREMEYQAKCRHQDFLDESGATARSR